MDKNIIFAFIPILALAIPVAAIVFHGIQKVARIRLEETRLRLQGDSGSPEEIQAIQNDVETMRRELSELQERVDFTERVLARPQAQQPLPPASRAE
ncbi:MAG: hypothetical protein ABI836_08940 [Gemmatimonadota bacterium]